MNNLLQDVRYAIRTLAKAPGFAVVSILTLALGIGANVAIFTVVHAILLRQLPFPQPQQLVRVFDDLRGSNTPDVGMSQPELVDLQSRSGAFQELSVLWPISANLTGTDRPERLEVLATSTNYFTLLGAHAQLGRIYTSNEEVPGFIEALVISDGFWHRQFGADPNVLGKRIRVDGDLYTIVGVMPPGFHHPGRSLQTEVDAYIAAGYAADPFPHPPIRSLRMIPGAIGRLKPGLNLGEAQARLDALAGNLGREYPNDYPSPAGWALRLVPVRDALVGKVQTELYVLFGAVGFVLLIACVNLANLLLARGASREREMAIRLALGAGRRRVIVQLLTESLLLAAISGAVALVTVVWLKNALLAFAPQDLPRLNEVGISAGVLVFAFFISIVTGILFGLVPALQAARPDQVASLREGGRGSGSSKHHMRISRTLVAAEVALSLALLVGAGLLLRSFWHLLEVNPGFQPHGVATAQLWVAVPNDPKADPYRNPDILAGFMREVLRRVSVLPGVQEAAMGSENSLPLKRARNEATFRIEGRAIESERTPTAEFASISPEYFKVLGIPLLSGRAFLDSDDTKSQPVAIIDQTLARRYWPGEDPLGKVIKLTTPPPGKDPSIVIVGVVGDIKSDGFDVAGAPHIYFPGYQFPPRGYVVYLHTATEPGTLVNQIRTEVQAVDPRVPIFSVRTMDQVVAESFSERRFALELLSAFAVVALLLASIGIYGVMAYTFSRRTHEIGVRIALGAQRKDILRMALSEGMALVGLGLACGLVGALFLTRFLRSMLFAVTPTDPVTFVAIAALLTTAALLACYIPAQRATRVDPLVALREE